MTTNLTHTLYFSSNIHLNIHKSWFYMIFKMLFFSKIMSNQDHIENFQRKRSTHFVCFWWRPAPRARPGRWIWQRLRLWHNNCGAPGTKPPSCRENKPNTLRLISLEKGKFSHYKKPPTVHHQTVCSVCSFYFFISLKVFIKHNLFTLNFSSCTCQYNLTRLKELLRFMFDYITWR